MKYLFKIFFSWVPVVAVFAFADDPVLNLVSPTGDPLEFTENDLLVKVPIELDVNALVDVYFDYCFDMSNSTATATDFNLEGDFFYPASKGHLFPVCGDNVGNVVIQTGEQKTSDASSESVWINVRKDSNIEKPNETLRLRIMNLSGAVLPGNKLEGYFDLNIVDANIGPMSADFAVSVDEDNLFTFDSPMFEYASAFDKAEKGILITSLPTRGFLISHGDTLTTSDLNKFVPINETTNVDLQYIGVMDGFGAPYATFTFKIMDEDNNVSENPYTVTVNVNPVNDMPLAHDTVYSINENVAAGTAAAGKIRMEDVDDSQFTYAFDPNDAKFTVVSSIFAINSTTGTITVKKAGLDYEALNADTTMVIRVVVTDAASTTGGTGKLADTALVTIKIKDVTESSETSVTETMDCVNYSGEKPDSRCAYQRLEAGAKGLLLFVVDVDKDPVMANALPNTDFYVYAPKASSDSVYVSLISNGAKVQHMDKVNSGETGLVGVVVDALYPINNVAIGTSRSASVDDAFVARLYNFYVPSVQFCQDSKCEKPISDVTKIQLEVGDSLVVYARAFIPVGPGKNLTDSTLEKTFYIKPLESALRYYSLSGVELPLRPFGYQIDFRNGRAVFVIRATKAVTGDGSPFTINSYIDFTAEGDTNFIVTQEFPGNLSFLSTEEPLIDSSMVQDTTHAVGDSSIVDTSVADTVKHDSHKVQILSPVEQEMLSQNSVNVVWTVDGVEQDSLNWQFLEEGMNEIIREYCSSDGLCAADTVRVFYKKDDDGSDDGVEFASPSFHIEMTGPFEFKIVMNEDVSDIKKSYAVMDLQGRVLLQGSIDAQETLVPALSKGSYIVKVGLGHRRVNIR